MFVEGGEPHEFLQGRFLHARDVTEAHVIVDQREHLVCVVIGKTQTCANLLRNFTSDLHVTIETDALGSDAECGWFACVVQQGSPSQRGWARMRQVFEQEQRMHEDVAFGMKLRRLLNSLHHGNLRQDFSKQTGLIEQKESAS